MKHERCEDIFSAITKFCRFQRMFENNKSVTSNIEFSFQMLIIGHQIELLTKVTKELTDEIDLMKQHDR